MLLCKICPACLSHRPHLKIEKAYAILQTDRCAFCQQIAFDLKFVAQPTNKKDVLRT